MKKCCICKRKIYFWNKFYREHGFCQVLNKKTFMPEGQIYFCSIDCYEKTLNIQRKPSKIFFRYFKKVDNDWVHIKKEEVIK